MIKKHSRNQHEADFGGGDDGIRTHDLCSALLALEVGFPMGAQY